MNPMQERQAQVDGWRERHHFHHRIPVSEQTPGAIDADHTEALDMNANGDAGLAGFLGTDAELDRLFPPVPAAGKPLALALIEIANAIIHGRLPIPTSVDLWHQSELNAGQLLVQADRFGVPIKAHEHSASIRLQPINGAHIRYYLTCTDVSADAMEDYGRHNAQCLAADPEDPFTPISEPPAEDPAPAAE
jgi:hypothetical protein